MQFLYLNLASSPKISASGVKASVVPRRLGVGPSGSSAEVGSPRAKLWRKSCLFRAVCGRGAVAPRYPGAAGRLRYVKSAAPFAMRA